MKYTGYAIVAADPTKGESLPPKVLEMMSQGWQPTGGAFYVPNASDPKMQGLICQSMVS